METQKEKQTQPTMSVYDALKKIIQLTEMIDKKQSKIELQDESIVDLDSVKITPTTFKRVILPTEIEERLINTLVPTKNNKLGKRDYKNWLRVMKIIRKSVSGMAAMKAHEEEGIWVSLKPPAKPKKKEKINVEFKSEMDKPKK